MNTSCFSDCAFAKAIKRMNKRVMAFLINDFIGLIFKFDFEIKSISVFALNPMSNSVWGEIHLVCGRIESCFYRRGVGLGYRGENIMRKL